MSTDVGAYFIRAVAGMVLTRTGPRTAQALQYYDIIIHDIH